MTTERGDQVRLSLYGCSHKPKVSAMSSPPKGEEFFCALCRRRRIVLGVVTTWAHAVVTCTNCSWSLRNDGKRGKKALIALALRHANNRQHKLIVTHDGMDDEVKPESTGQLPLIDDLLLPP